MKKKVITLVLILVSFFMYAQHTVTGTFPGIANQKIKLKGFNCFETYVIDSVQVNNKGEFKLFYDERDYGMASLSTADNQSLLVCLKQKV